MPNFKSYNQGQVMLLPPSLTDWLPADHSCFVLNDIVDNLDISAIEHTYSDQGSPAYHPRMMIKIMFYAYSKGIRSSRKIETLTQEDIVVRYLSANQQPDHGTLSLFRQVHLKDLETLFAQIVILCDGLGLVDLTDISIDGSIFKANASKRKTLDKEAIAKLKAKIGEILTQAEAIDKEEDQRFGEERGYHQMPEQLKDGANRQQEIARLKQHLAQLDQADETINQKQSQAATKEDQQLKRNATHNLTDHEANLMKMKNSQTHEPAYNGQIATNHQIVLAYDISDNGTDTKMLIPMIKETEKNTGKQVTKVKADASYFSKDNIEAVNEKQIDAYIPDQKKAIEEKQERDSTVPRYDRRNFHYDEAHDQFICPAGKHLPLLTTEKGGRKKYVCHDCHQCSARAKCSQGKQRSIYIDWQLEQYKNAMRIKLNTEQGKLKYLERMSDVEPPFSHIKDDLRAGHFLCRGRPKVKIEFGLSCLAHNLTKIANWVKENQEKWQNTQLAALVRARVMV